jgi:hypothetical protein
MLINQFRKSVHRGMRGGRGVPNTISTSAESKKVPFSSAWLKLHAQARTTMRVLAAQHEERSRLVRACRAVPLEGLAEGRGV